MNCETCKKESTAVEPVPYIVHESAMARNERAVKRMLIALLVAISMLFVSNALWLYAWTQYDYSGEESVITRTYSQDGEGLNIIGDNNGVDYNGTESDNN